MKAKILADFLTAYKAGDSDLKNCLGGIKSEITKWETSKQNSGTTIVNSDIIKIITSEIKKRKDAIVLYTQEGSIKGLDNAYKEKIEMEMLEAYLPPKLTDNEITDIVLDFLKKSNADHTQTKVMDIKTRRGLFGSIMKLFSSEYLGRYDASYVKFFSETILDLK